MTGMVGDTRYAGDPGASKHIVSFRVRGSRLEDTESVTERS